MPILHIRDESGNFIPITAIKGDKGKSAYEQAKEGGYTGTEEEFIDMLNGLTKVTKEDIGLGNVDNTSDANKPVSAAQATAIADAKSAGTIAQSNLNTHTSNKSNPHGVTASQIGAAEIVTGTYTGDGNQRQSINLGFAPKAVFIVESSGKTYENYNNTFAYYGGLALADKKNSVSVTYQNPSGGTNHATLDICRLSGYGFAVFYKNIGDTSVRYEASTNYNGKVFHYIALK